MAERELHIRRIARLEAIWRGRIARVLRAEVANITAIIRSRGIQAAQNAAHNLIMIESLADVLRSMYTAIGIMSANITARQIGISAREKKAFGKDEQWIQAILNYFRLFILNKAVLPMTITMRDQILTMLQKGIDEGWSIDKMAFELENASFPAWMARRAVRTEIAKAAFYGRQVAEQDSDWQLNKTWIAADDPRTRPSHHKIDNKTVAYEAKFVVDVMRGRVRIGTELMDGPGDPNATAGNVINCRCSLSVRAARDKNGRLIPKARGNSNISVILPGRFVRTSPVVTI